MGKGTDQRRPFTLGGPEYLIAIDDDGYEELLPGLRRATADWTGPAIRFVRASELNDPDLDADLYFGRYKPTAPGRHKLFVTSAKELYEQDDAGIVYMNGVPAWDSAPISYGNPRTLKEGRLTLFQECAMVFTRPQGASHAIRIRTIGPIIDLAAEPRTRVGWKPRGWLERAHQEMAPFEDTLLPPRN